MIINGTITHKNGLLNGQWMENQSNEGWTNQKKENEKERKQVKKEVNQYEISKWIRQTNRLVKSV